MSLSNGENARIKGMRLTIRNPTPPAAMMLAQSVPGGIASSGLTYPLRGNATNSSARPGPHSNEKVSKADCCPPFPTASTASINSSEDALPSIE